MKTMNLVTLGVISFGAILLGGTQAFADAEQPVAKSDATVLFSKDDDPVTPVTPPDGGDGGEVDPGGSDGNSGNGDASFNIAWVSHFRFNDRKAAATGFLKDDFEPIKLNANGMTLWAKGTELSLKPETEGETGRTYTNIPNFIQVVDNRGKLSGWNVSVTATEFTGKDADDAESTLTGAELSLNDLSITGPAGVTAPTFNNSIVIGTGTPVMTAAAGAGTGNWNLNFGQTENTGGAYETLAANTGVKLDIPARAQAKSDVFYKSTLTWTLTDGPAA